MRRISFVAASVAVLFIAFACGQERSSLPTDVLQSVKTTKSVTACASYTQIVALTQVVFGGGTPNVNSATKKLANIKGQLDDGKIAPAQAKGLELIAFITKHNRAERLPGTQAQVTELVNDILCWLGLSPTVAAAADAFVLLPPAPGDPPPPPDTLITTDGNAGVIVPPGAVSEPTVIAIAPIEFTITFPGAGPLHTKLDQYPGFYYITQISANDAPLLNPVVVAVCPSPSVPVDIRTRLRLGHDASSGFELTPRADASFLTCPVSASISAAASGAMPARRAAPGVSVVGKRANIGDVILEATGGVGGTTGTFSPFGTVDELLTATGGVGGTTGTFILTGVNGALTLLNKRAYEFSGLCAEGEEGSSVSEACRPTVTVTTRLGTLLEGVPLDFSVTAGGGKVSAQTVAGCDAEYKDLVTVNTNQSGKSAACWNLGAVGQNTVTAVPSAGGDVPPTAVFSPASLSWSMTAVHTDNTPPVIADPVVTGTLGDNDWYTSDVSVSWDVSDAESQFTTDGCSGSLATNSAGTTFTCSAENSVGLKSTRSILLKRDATPPNVSVAVTGTKGKDDWYVTPVDVTWTVVTDGPSGAGARTGCNNAVVNTNGTFDFTCSAKSGAGLSGNASTSFKRDASVPSVVANVIGTKGTEDWYVSPVDVSWTVSANGPSGIGSQTGCAATVVNSDGNFSFDCKAESGAGLSSATYTAVGKRDATKPTVAYTGNLGTYGVNQSISILCSTSDNTSGVASDNCADVQGPAYNFPLGPNSRSATAVDHAGNSGTGSTTFTVVLTTSNLCALTRQFSTSSAIASSMCNKLDNAAAAAARGELTAKAGLINAYMQDVRAQTDKALTLAQASVLTRLAQQL